MRALVVVNDGSGDRVPNSEKFRKVEGSLRSAGFEFRVVDLCEGDDARRIVRQAVSEDGCEAVIVAGGDGTVSQAAAELVHRPCILGILPLGTYNNIASSIGLPVDPVEAAAVLCAGRRRKIDVGRIDSGEFFFEVAGAGLDAELFPLGEEIKGGRWARLSAFARRLIRFRAARITLSFDRTVREALDPRSGGNHSREVMNGTTLTQRSLLVAIANGPFYGGGFTVAPGASLDDGCLTVAVYRDFTKVELMRHFFTIMGRQKQYSPKVDLLHVRSVEISARGPLTIHADGVAVGEAPRRMEAIPAALEVFAP